MSISEPSDSKGNRPNNSRPNKKPRSENARNARVVKKAVDAEPLRKWLATLNVNVKPTVHVNGPSQEAAILTVDFGAPISPVRLSGEQSLELTSQMKKLAAEFYSGDVNIRVSNDSQHGIYWASLG